MSDERTTAVRVPNASQLSAFLTGERGAVIHAIQSEGGRVLLVGGSVRDLALGHGAKDFDLEVYGLAVESLVRIVERVAQVEQVGVSFGVLKTRLDGLDIDLSLPRRESKEGRGHRGFIVDVDPQMDPREAASRRDFTWNAMAIDLHTGLLLDYFGGLEDLRSGVIRHVGPAFAEDPLRVLRAMQFAARFGFRMHEDTARLCESLLDEYDSLAIERVWVEWEKWAQRGRTPSGGLATLLETGWIRHYPELFSLIGCPQDAAYHPEGDVWTHTTLACDAAASIADRDGLVGDDRLVLVFGALCHDLGKPMTTVHESDGRITSAGHASTGIPLTRSFLARIGFPERLVERVASIVSEHMTHISLAAGGSSGRGVRRLAARLGRAGNTIAMLGAVVEADQSGRTPLPAGMPESMRKCLEQAERLGILLDPPQAILLGRHLIEMGIQPGREMGLVLAEAMEVQLDGGFTELEGALVWARRRFGPEV